MTKDDYNNALYDLQVQHERAKKTLAIEYALSNNPYKVGETFTDHMGTIRIEEIKVTLGTLSGLPSCVYTGVELKKDGTPKKVNPIRKAYQSNEVKP